MILVSLRYLFYQPMDEKIRTWTLCFPAKENRNIEKALPLKQQLLGCKENHFYSLPFGQAEASIYYPRRHFNQPQTLGRQCLEYIEKSSRYDKKTYLILEKVLPTSTVKNTFSPIGQYYKNICYLNKTRRRVTKENVAIDSYKIRITWKYQVVDKAPN